jgi:hypothetical protein
VRLRIRCSDGRRVCKQEKNVIASDQRERSNLAFKISIFLFLTVFIIINAALAAQENHFRKTRWGMTKDEVKAAEKSAPVAEQVSLYCIEGNCLVYNGENYGRKCKYFYRFYAGALIDAGYFYDFSDDKAVKYYTKLKKELTAKLGKPAYDPVTGEKKTESNNRGKIIIYNSYFKTKNCIINLHCVDFTGFNDEVAVLYYDKKNEKIRSKLAFLF